MTDGQARCQEESDFLLIAEDNPADVHLIRLALKRHGVPCEIYVVQDGESAVRFIEHTEADALARCPTLAVLDLNLPKIGGDQVLQRLRECSKWSQVPVIVISSSLSHLDRATAIDLGASAYFSKPTDLEQFLELGSLIKNLLRRNPEVGE